MGINKVILVGNAGKDPEIRYLENNTPVCNFSLATSETYTNRNNEKVTTTEWHNIVVWRALAEVAHKYVKKGTQVYIEGKIRSRSYDDRDGNKRYVTEIVGDTLQLLGKRPDEMNTTPSSSSSSAPSAQTQPESTGPAPTEFDTKDASPSDAGNDLPF